MKTTPALAALALACLPLTACSEIAQGAKEGFELGKREGMIEVLGAAELQLKAGIALPGDLSCKVTEGTGEQTPVTCSATTTDGRQVSLTGTITSTAAIENSDWIRGTFVATVNGKEVLRTSCIGNC
ncbi:MAG TPA: hypothetical protein VHJ17_16985 [Thermomonospora sp.]|nr:hypothetical protein [Thermomonospora sp.]